MKIFSTNRCWMYLSVVCLVVMVTPAVFAVSNQELLRVEQNQSFQGACCFTWLEQVRVTEPAAIVPVIVTWSTDYQSTGPFLAGLSVNGRPCQFFGSGSIARFGVGDGTGDFESRYLQWTILPDEGLIRGRNTFTLCGGATLSPIDIITLGFNTLTVRLSK